MRILTQNFAARLAVANQAIRALRAEGYRVVTCQVEPGDRIVKPKIVVHGGKAGVLASFFDRCEIVREVGGNHV